MTMKQPELKMALSNTGRSTGTLDETLIADALVEIDMNNTIGMVFTQTEEVLQKDRDILQQKMTMMMRLLLLSLCLMHLKEVAGTITLTTDNSLVKIGDEVAMTCKDTEEVAIEIYFAGQAIGNCNLFGGTICSVSEQTLYSVSIDESPTGYNLMTFTIKSFAVSNCGEYTCLKISDPRVKDTATVEHKLSYGDSCGTCGQCSHSTSMSCSSSSTCKCNKGYTYKDNVCDIDKNVKVALGDTAIIICNITGDFSNPRWDDGSSKVYISEGKTTFNTATTTSRWSRSKDTKNLIITSIENSDDGTYKCSITTPTTDSFTEKLTVTKPPECKCDCDWHRILWPALSFPSIFALIISISFVKHAGPKAKKLLIHYLGKQAPRYMIVWVVVSYAYSVIAVCFFNYQVCKNDCCEAVCDCVCNCWPVYIQIGYAVRAVDVIGIIIGAIAFVKGKRAYCENPVHGNERGLIAAESNPVPMSEADVHATNQPKDAKNEEAMDSNS